MDPQRPLSGAGRTHAEWLATTAASRGVKPHVICHSGKLRARQTAEAFWRLCNPLAVFTAQRGLQPTDPPQTINLLLAGEDLDLMLVGHMPNLPRILALLTHGSAEADVTFPQHGVVAVEKTQDGWLERWRLESAE
ncbi:MAG: SixA phosphatase family protein [Vicinamibacterales bacterium]